MLPRVALVIGISSSINSEQNHYDNYEEEEEEEAEEEEEEDGHHHDDPDDDAAVADNSRNKRLDRIATLTIPRRVTKAKLHSASTSRGTALLGF